jgi:hypothetical protein
MMRGVVPSPLNPFGRIDQAKDSTPVTPGPLAFTRLIA